MSGDKEKGEGSLKYDSLHADYGLFLGRFRHYKQEGSGAFT